MCIWYSNCDAKNDKVHRLKKNEVMLISKPHVHLQTMNKPPAKFQQDLYIEGGAALTKPPLNASKMPKHAYKVIKICCDNVHTWGTSIDHKHNICKVLKVLESHMRLKIWTDGRTDGRTLYGRTNSFLSLLRLTPGDKKLKICLAWPEFNGYFLHFSGRVRSDKARAKLSNVLLFKYI